MAVTGTLYAFEFEIRESLYLHKLKLQSSNSKYTIVEKKLPPSKIWQKGTHSYPNKVIHAVRIYADNRPSEVIYYNNEGVNKYYIRLLLNPYSGNIIQFVDMNTGFFAWILRGHMYLWLPEKYGRKFIGYFTVIFLVTAMVGLFLWLPSQLRFLKKQLTFSWSNKMKWKRKNADTHKIVGFYMLLPICIFCITGLFWSFDLFAEKYYQMMGGKVPIYIEPEANSQKFTLKNLDEIYYRYYIRYFNKGYLDFHAPTNSNKAIEIAWNPNLNNFFKTRYRFFDPNNKREFKINSVYSSRENLNVAEFLVKSNYDIHTGGVFGVWGKLLMFIFSLLIGSLPITGLLFYLGRKKYLT